MEFRLSTQYCTIRQSEPPRRAKVYPDSPSPTFAYREAKRGLHHRGLQLRRTSAIVSLESTYTASFWPFHLHFWWQRQHSTRQPWTWNLLRSQWLICRDDTTIQHWVQAQFLLARWATTYSLCLAPSKSYLFVHFGSVRGSWAPPKSKCQFHSGLISVW